MKSFCVLHTILFEKLIDSFVDKHLSFGLLRLHILQHSDIFLRHCYFWLTVIDHKIDIAYNTLDLFLQVIEPKLIFLDLLRYNTEWVEIWPEFPQALIEVLKNIFETIGPLIVGLSNLYELGCCINDWLEFLHDVILHDIRKNECHLTLFQPLRVLLKVVGSAVVTY